MHSASLLPHLRTCNPLQVHFFHIPIRDYCLISFQPFSALLPRASCVDDVWVSARLCPRRARRITCVHNLASQAVSRLYMTQCHLLKGDLLDLDSTACCEDSPVIGLHIEESQAALLQRLQRAQHLSWVRLVGTLIGDRRALWPLVMILHLHGAMGMS